MDWNKVYQKNADWLDQQAKIVRIEDQLSILRNARKASDISNEAREKLFEEILHLEHKLHYAYTNVTRIEKFIRDKMDIRPLLYVRDELFDDERELERNGFIRGYKF